LKWPASQSEASVAKDVAISAALGVRALHEEGYHECAAREPGSTSVRVEPSGFGEAPVLARGLEVSQLG